MTETMNEERQSPPAGAGRRARRGPAAGWARQGDRFRWPILAIWAVLAVVGGLQYTALESHLSLPDYSISKSESAATTQVLAGRFPRMGAEQVAVVVSAADGRAVEFSVRPIVTALRAVPGIDDIIDPTTAQVGGHLATADRRTAMILLALPGAVADRDATTDRIADTLSTVALPDGVTVDLTGETPLNKALADVEREDQARAEMIGLTLALLLLVWGLRSLSASVLAVGSAVLGVALSSAVLGLVAESMNMSQFALVVATIVGLGVGIDYALFVISRFVEEYTEFDSGPGDRAVTTSAALTRALQTSGHTVIISGVIVMVSLCSIMIIDGPVFREIAVAAGLVVLCSMIAAVTALPAALAVLAPRLVKRSRAAENKDPAASRWYRWVGHVQRRPVLWGVPALLVLILASLPLTGMRLGLDLGISTLSHTQAGRGYATAADAFGGSAVAPISVTACVGERRELTGDDADRVAGYLGSLRGHDGVRSTASVFDTVPAGSALDFEALVTSPVGRAVDGSLIDDTAHPRCLLAMVQPKYSVDAPETGTLVRDMRSRAAPLAEDGITIAVGGMSAQYRDLADETARMFPLVVILVLVLSLIYLVITLRSVFIPIKAIVLNALATAAALGTTTAVFQYGYGERLFDFTSVGSIQAFLPVAMFAVLFGLSMDYEVFMVRRIREEYLDCGDTAEAVRRAMAKVAPQISIAGLIMIAVFGSLVVADVLELKQIGFGLAIAIAIDISLIRLIMVPVFMSMADQLNWWFPGGGSLVPKPSTDSLPGTQPTGSVGAEGSR
ncbi:MMPL family transporter [Nocardia sp. NPDC058497]|uniref:MMPL family transporter n=1 Tax=Nocardia sp. NPDC058497 TaxID=3346529 RepID=UPI00364E45A9